MRGKRLALAASERAHWIVADGYEFVPGYQQALRSAGHRRAIHR